MESSFRYASVGSPLMERIQRAIEVHDVEAFADLFAEDATLEEISSLNPPSHPMVVRGRSAILGRLRDDTFRDPISGWSRQITESTIVDAVETDDGLAFTELRTYAAGDKAVVQHVARKHSGRIERDRMVIAWDAD